MFEPGRPVHRHRGAALVQVVLGELAGRAARIRRAGDQRDELVRVHGAAAAGPDHVLRVGVQFAQRPGRRVGDPQRQPGARRAGHPQHPLPRLGVAELHHHLLQAQRPGARRQRPDDRAQLGQRRLHGRPHVQLDAVPVQPGQLAVGGPGRAQAVQAGVQDALELRQAGDPPGVVPHDGELADVGQGDEPLVVGHLAALDAEQVHVRSRGQPGQLEPGEPPHAQPFGDQRVPAALGPVLGRLPVRPAAEGEPVRPAAPLPVRPAHGDRDPVDRRRDDAELAADPVGAGVRVAAAVLLGRLGGDVEVDEHGPAGRERLDQLRQVGPGRALRAVGHGRDDQVVVPVVGVLRGQQRAAAPLGDLDVLAAA